MMTSSSSRYHRLGIVDAGRLIGLEFLKFGLGNPVKYEGLLKDKMSRLIEGLGIDPNLHEIGDGFRPRVVLDAVAFLANGTQVHGVLDNVRVCWPDA